MFTNGQKVACVDDVFPPSLIKYFSALPKKDSVYTIRGIAPGTVNGRNEGEIAVYLEEIQGWINSHGIECGFNSERFAPLEEYKVELMETINKPEEVFV